MTKQDAAQREAFLKWVATRNYGPLSSWQMDMMHHAWQAAQSSLIETQAAELARLTDILKRADLYMSTSGDYRGSPFEAEVVAALAPSRAALKENNDANK